MGTTDLATGAVGGAKLKNDAVATSKLKDGAVSTEKIKVGAVTTAKLKGGAVVTSKLKNGAVSTAKIKNGAVTYAKLSSDLKAVADDAEIFDYRDYGRPSNVTQKIFARKDAGPFTDCSAGPDTEVSDFSRTDLGGGVIEVIRERNFYAGGVGGTLCAHRVNTIINDAEASRVVQVKKYSVPDGLLEQDRVSDYDPGTCPDCGMGLNRSDMRVGIDFANQSFWTEAVSGHDFVAISKRVLTKVGVSEIINEGEAGEETFDNCIETWEERRSELLGYGTFVRYSCSDIGTVSWTEANWWWSTQYPANWELKSYTIGQ